MTALCAPPVVLDVRLVEPSSVDVDDAVPADELHLDGFARKSDQPLDERPAGAAAAACLRRRLEDDDLTPPWVAQVVDEPVGEDAVREPGLAAGGGPRAVERGLHRGRRDPVRVDHVGLDDEDDHDRPYDRDDPVDGDTKTVRETAGEAVDRISHVPLGRWDRLQADPGVTVPAGVGGAFEGLLCSLLQVSICEWFPERSTSGTVHPRNCAGRV